MCSEDAIRKMLALHNAAPALVPVFFTECVAWKQNVIRDISKALYSEQIPVYKYTRDLVELPPAHKPIVPDLAIMSIECDDISNLSNTPRSVLSEDGRSGRSFLEFLAWLGSLPVQSRPAAIMLECVAGLDHFRQAASWQH